MSTWRKVGPVLILLALVVCTTEAQRQRRGPPPPKSILDKLRYRAEPIRRNATYVAIDGGSLKDAQTGEDALFARSIELEDFEVLDKNTPCGFEAWVALTELVRGGRVNVPTERSLRFNKQGKTKYRAAYDTGVARGRGGRGLDLAEMMVSRGLALAKTPRLMNLQRRAQRERRGCLWRGLEAEQDQWETTTDAEDEGEVLDSVQEDFGGRIRSGPIFGADRTSRLIVSDSWPTGFTAEEHLPGESFDRPVDFVFLPGTPGHMLVAENKGRIWYVKDGAVKRDAPFMDLTSICATYQDRGIMSIAIPNNYATGNRRLFVFFVYEHDPRPESFFGPKSSSVIRTNIVGEEEQPDTRAIVVGKRHGPGCDGFGANVDCIPAEGKSHVGGSLGFNVRNELFVGVGDGAVAIITEVAHRSQQMNTFAGKILRLTQNGFGIPSNPFINGSPLWHRRSKMFAIGFRNPLHLHTSPTDPNILYTGDTQWNEEEEMNVVRRGDNHGWPCYEGTVKRPEYENEDVCRGKTAADFNFPLVAWKHASSAASMIGPRITLTGWPAYYRNVIVYGDIAAKWIGFAKVDSRDNLVEDQHRIRIGHNIVQARVGPGNTLVYSDVRGGGGLYRISYRRPETPFRIVDEFPPRWSRGIFPIDGTISVTFSSTLDPRFVEGNVVLMDLVTREMVAYEVTHRYSQNTLDIKPLSNLLPNRRYRVAFRVGLRDLDLRRAQNQYFAFTTGGAGESVPPQVVSHSPSDGAVVPRDVLMSVTFDTPMDPDTLPANIRVTDTANIEAVVDITSSEYLTTTRTWRFRADFRYGTAYTVTVVSGDSGVRSSRSATMESDFYFSFRTENAPAANLAVFIDQPVTQTVTVGENINFSGRALFQGTQIPVGAMSWSLLTVHCVYDSDSCHDHTSISTRGVTSGSFVAVNHQDKFYYAVDLEARYQGEIARTSVRINVREADLTLLSNPEGADLSVNGYTSRAPVELKVAVASSLQLVAPETYQGRAFANWSCGGARSNTRSMPAGGLECTANYA